MTIGRKRTPTIDTQVDVLMEQGNNCLYCGHFFGQLITHRKGETVLEVVWDHFVPYAYLGTNPNDNWVACCQLCNSYKSDLYFEDIIAVRLYIYDKAIKNEHDPLPFWWVDDEQKIVAPPPEPKQPKPERIPSQAKKLKPNPSPHTDWSLTEWPKHRRR